MDFCLQKLDRYSERIVTSIPSKENKKVERSKQEKAQTEFSVKTKLTKAPGKTTKGSLINDVTKINKSSTLKGKEFGKKIL